MSKLRRFLVCDSPEQAADMDAILCEFVCHRDGNRGSQWSGTSVRNDNKAFGILWDHPAEECLGDPATHPELVIETEVIDKSGQSNWADYVPPAPDVADSLP